MTKEKLADRIKQLINISYTLISFLKRLQKLHDKYLPNTALDRHEYKISEIPMLIRFLNCTFYYQMILNLNTILSPLQKNVNKKEQSIFELIDLETDVNKKAELLESANRFRDLLESKELHLLRHKLIAHKDLESAGDTEIMYLNFIKDEFIDFSEKLLQEIDKFLSDNFDVTYSNTFEQMYSKSFNKMLEILENEIKNFIKDS